MMNSDNDTPTRPEGSFQRTARAATLVISLVAAGIAVLFAVGYVLSEDKAEAEAQLYKEITSVRDVDQFVSNVSASDRLLFYLKTDQSDELSQLVNRLEEISDADTTMYHVVIPKSLKYFLKPSGPPVVILKDGGELAAFTYDSGNGGTWENIFNYARRNDTN